MTSLDFNDVTENRVGGAREAPTSQAAAWDNLPRSGSQRFKVLEAIVEAGDTGLTNEELTEHLGFPHGASGSSAAKRASELYQAGWIMDSGRTRPTPRGSRARVWVLTPEAEELLDS